jgi:hypothetical protein
MLPQRHLHWKRRAHRTTPTQTTTPSNSHSTTAPQRRYNTRGPKAKPSYKARANLAIPARAPEDALNPDTGTIADYRKLLSCSEGKLWAHANMEEIRRLFQGLGPESSIPVGTNTLHFIHRNQVPRNKKATYISVVCTDRPEKGPEKEQVRRVPWTVGGDNIVFHGYVSTKTADLTTTKILFNSVISTTDGRFMTGDLKDFYLGTAMDEYKYMRILMHLIPDEIVDMYNLHDKIIDGHVYAKVRKGMYGLPQAKRIANDKLQKFLLPHGYVPCPITAGLWKHLHSNLMFTLVVDNFDVRYVHPMLQQCDTTHDNLERNIQSQQRLECQKIHRPHLRLGL